MKHVIFLTVLLFIFAACTVDQQGRVNETLGRIAEHLDRNADGTVTNRELKDSTSDPTFWIAITSGLLGLLGIGGAAGAKKLATKVESETDEQWDNEMKRLAALEQKRLAVERNQQ